MGERSMRRPGRPENLILTPGHKHIEVEWDAPADPGEPALRGYVVFYRRKWSDSYGDGPHMTRWWDSIIFAKDRCMTLRHLIDGQPYEVQVAAQNREEDGPFAGPRVAVPNPPVGYRVPGVPRNLVLTPSDQSIEVEWDAPADPGEPALEQYEVYYRSESSTLTGGVTISLPKNHTSATIKRSDTERDRYLENGQPYHVLVVAENRLGQGPGAGPLSVTPAKPGNHYLPSTPQNLRLMPGDGRIEVEWDLPLYSGKPSMEGYKVSWRKGSSGSWDSRERRFVAGHSTTLTNLDNGQPYQVQVVALNGEGEGPVAGPLSATPASPEDKRVPGAPKNLRLMPGNGLVVVEWDAPGDVGKPDLHGYGVYFCEAPPLNWFDGKTLWVKSDTHKTNIYLENGRPYDVQVVALNSEGEGPVAGPLLVTPAGSANNHIPGTPQGPHLTPRARFAEVEWSGPISTGNPALEGYMVHYLEDERAAHRGSGLQMRHLSEPRSLADRPGRKDIEHPRPQRRREDDLDPAGHS